MENTSAYEELRSSGKPLHKYTIKENTSSYTYFLFYTLENLCKRQKRNVLEEKTNLSA